MAYGSPNSLDEVGDYLAQVRGGRVSTPEEIEHLKQRYQRVGGQTPLFQITKSQADALEKKLVADGTPARVLFGMKNWRIQPSLVTALSNRVSHALSDIGSSERIMVIFTAHSLPLRVVSNDDPYRAQLLETSQLIAKDAGVTDWDFAFQSASGPTGTWLGPSLKEKISEFSNKGIKRILVCPVGFVSDHLEILYDLDVEARDYANSCGIELARTLSLNDDPKFIEALAAVATPILVRQMLTH